MVFGWGHLVMLETLAGSMGDGTFRNDDTEIFDRRLVERAFLGFEEEVVFLEAGEDVMGKGVKEWQGGVEEENIIKVDDKMAFIDKVREEAKRALEGCFPFITF